jgi:NADH:ubiquinone oxidoreductase subunit C
MKETYSIEKIQAMLRQRFGESVSVNGNATQAEPGCVAGVAALLKETPELGFDYLDMIAAVDYGSYFELVYSFVSLERNQHFMLKTRLNRNNAVLPTLSGLWRGADFQEREIYDLFGINFEGHANLKRIAMWEGFEGHPLRKDYNCGA